MTTGLGLRSRRSHGTDGDAVTQTHLTGGVFDPNRVVGMLGVALEVADV